MVHKKIVDFWPEMLVLMDEEFKKKKGRKYPWCPKELKLIKTLRGWYTAPEVLALWTIYLRRSPFWGSRTGHLISGLWAERSILMDDPELKKIAVEFEKKIGMKEQKELWSDLVKFT